MDALSFWKQKIVQFLHDPPSKPFAMRPGMGGHEARAKEIFERLAGVPFKYRWRWPDWAATGADRPVLPRFQVHWWLQPYVTHPLAGPDHVLSVKAPSETHSIRLLQEEELNDLERLAPDDALTQEATEAGPKALTDWNDAAALQETFYFLWRSYMRGPKRDPLSMLWEVMPADSRCPDHSVWNHMRMTSALAFLNKAKLPPEQQPWLLCFSLGPVGRFIAEARTSRDLWIGSFLLSDLIWHAMEPIVRRYGPDCIVYPDLHANPYVDTWLAAHERYHDALPEGAATGTFAAVLPNTFTALIPRGGAGHLPDLADLAKQAEKAVTHRWQELAELVKTWLQGNLPGGWQDIWKKQHETPPIYTVWSAVPWMRADEEREDRLKPWVEGRIWLHVEEVRDAYQKTNERYLNLERGFDYALTHHLLRQRHAQRKATAPDPAIAGALGEKCTLCGKRQALTPSKTADSIDSDRQAARSFWSHELLDPDRTGAERLCAVCTMKRFLIPAGYDPKTRRLTGLNRVWASADIDLVDLLDKGNKVRVPFPSTATLAAQVFLGDITSNQVLQPALKRVVECANNAGIRQTSFPRALPRLSAAHRDGSEIAQEFLLLEAEDVLFPEVIGPNSRKAQSAKKEKNVDIQALHDAVVNLREEAARLGLGAPGTHIAVVKLDGDSMGKLLLGDPDRLHANFHDILHPDAPGKLVKAPGWDKLLGQKRLTGPSLHAFISRALGHFSHRIVPWVVEREFSGCLIYAGGDDVLALVPAPQALGLCARLQQIYAAGWIIDSCPDEIAWDWRHKGWRGRHDEGAARRRFAPIVPSKNVIPWPVPQQQLAPHVVSQQPWPAEQADIQGELLPLLGPGQSLSASIIYAHYKTPLSGLVKAAETLLEDEAKDRAGRGAVALRLRSRGGEKLTCALKWKSGEDPLGAYRLLSATTEGFRTGRIPGRLPYKLRELSGLVHAARASHAQDTDKGHDALVRLARGLFAEACERGKSTQEWEAACQLWLMGLGLGESAHWDNPEAGLLLCRGLASLDAGKEEA
jgi:CRISPR-associated protein Cmr2